MSDNHSNLHILCANDSWMIYSKIDVHVFHFYVLDCEYGDWSPDCAAITGQYCYNTRNQEICCMKCPELYTDDPGISINYFPIAT